MIETPRTLLHRLCNQPSELDWRRFVELFTPLVQRWLKRFSLRADETDDFLQELFTHLFVQFPRFQYDEQKSFRGWLYTICYRLAIAWNQRRQNAGGLSEGITPLVTEDPREVIDELEYTRYLVERGLAIIHRDFPETTWNIFRAVAMEGRSGIEVAKEYNTTANAVYLIRARVLARLRTELDCFRN